MLVDSIKNYLLGLQNSICKELEALDFGSQFTEDIWQKSENAGGGITRILTGKLFSKAGVNFSHVFGNQLPPAATSNRPELLGRNYGAMGVSVVIHPDNPYIPTTHANIRFFYANKDKEESIWWFGGGWDLTPYYGFVEDCQHWHQTAFNACLPFGPEIYPRFKKWCDDYFFLKHRNEPRGIGGLFFDDYNKISFDHSFALTRSIGDHFLPAYLPIVLRCMSHPFGAKEKAFQNYRRGRYVEFNLIYDRGTLFGLQSGGRTESILMSLPPEVRWDYNWHPEPGSAEEKLYTDFLPARDWLSLSSLTTSQK